MLYSKENERVKDQLVKRVIIIHTAAETLELANLDDTWLHLVMSSDSSPSIFSEVQLDGHDRLHVV